MSDQEEYEIISPEFIRQFLAQCEMQKHLLETESAEGRRLSDQFRKLFPNVSDKDLGTLIVIFVRAFTVLSDSSVITIGDNFQTMIASYSYCAADILRGVSDLDGL